MADRSSSRMSVIAAFAAIYLFWGATFLAIRYAVAEVPPLLTIAIRCLGGALVLYVWIAARGELERVTRAQWVTSTLAGLFLFVGCHGVLAWAEQRVSSGQAALFMTTIPLWLVLLNSMRERRAPSRMVVAGLVLGTLGVALLAGGRNAWAGTLLDRFALIGAGLSWAAGSLIARDGSRPRSATQSTAMQLAGGGMVVLLLSGLVGELSAWDWSQVTTRGSLSLAFLVLGGTVLGFGAYTWLLRVTTPAAVGTYAFVNPVVALALAWLVGDEPFSIRTIAAAAIVLAGVALIWRSSAQNSHSGRSESPPRAERGEAARSKSGLRSPSVGRADPSRSLP